MAHVKITWLTDVSDCDTCGDTYADGAIVSVDDVEVLNLEPTAHCFGGVTYDNYDVYQKVFEYLGHTIEHDFEGNENGSQY